MIIPCRMPVIKSFVGRVFRQDLSIFHILVKVFYFVNFDKKALLLSLKQLNEFGRFFN